MRQATWSYDNKLDGFFIITDQDIKKGDEICVYYGKNESKNFHSFFTHGFVQEPNETDVMVMSL